VRVQGRKSRFVFISDPPFPWGVGVEDPDYEYWIVPAYVGQSTRVWVRRLPVGNREPDPWEEVERKDLSSFLPFFWLGDQLSQLEVEGWECRVCHRPAETPEALCSCPEGFSHCSECHEKALRGLRETVEMVKRKWPRSDSRHYWERRLEAMEKWTKRR